MNGAGIFFLLLLLLVIIPAVAWVGWTRWRAHKQGLPPPPLSAYNPFKKLSSSSRGGSGAGGVVGWVKDKVSSIKNRGTGLGGGGGGGDAAHSGGRGSFSQLDPDGAWDDRVGHEADSYGRIGDYEEQELGMHPAAGAGGYAGRGNRQELPDYGDDRRGRSRNRDELSYVGGGQQGLDQRYDEEVHGAPRANPFGDDAEPSSLRGVSPRPYHVDEGTQGYQAYHNTHDSEDAASTKTGRQSMFREAM